MSSCFCGSFGNDNSGLNIVYTPCCFNVRRNSSDSPLTYGMTMAVRLIGRCCWLFCDLLVLCESCNAHSGYPQSLRAALTCSSSALVSSGWLGTENNSCFSFICEQASEKEPKARTPQRSICTVHCISF